MAGLLRGAIIGFGFIATNGHLAEYLEREDTSRDFRIVAVADICAARRRLAARLLPRATIYPDHRALLRDRALALDFVDIATPPSAHAAIAHAALGRGLHVLCEKPLATTAKSAASVLRHAVRARRVVFPCHNYKHAPAVKAATDLIEAGRIGRVKLVSLSTYRTTHAKGVSEWRPDWRREHTFAGGGIAMDHGSHTFYLAFDWLSAYPQTVTAKAFALDGWDTEDNISCVLGFPNGVAQAQLSWTAGVRKVIYTIHGDRGAIRIEDDEIELSVVPPKVRSRDGDGPQNPVVERQRLPSKWMDASHSTWYGPLLDEFRAAIEAGDYVGKEARDAFFCVNAIEAAYASSRNNCRELSLVSDVAQEPGRV